MNVDFQSETDSDYTSYWRDWVRTNFPFLSFSFCHLEKFALHGVVEVKESLDVVS